MGTRGRLVSIQSIWFANISRYGRASNPESLGRFFTDMLFFPTTLLKIKDAEKPKEKFKIKSIDQSAELKQVEQILLGHNEASFNKAFGDVFAKMLLIGTQGTTLTPFSEGSATC
jgi:hypothetical protein